MNALPHDRIALEPLAGRVRARVRDTVLADSRNVLRLHERGYQPRDYFPRADVSARALRASHTVTHCPYKGDATYYHFFVDRQRLADAAWSYRHPVEGMAALADRIAFDHADIALDCLDA